MTKEEAITYAKRVVDLGLNDETQAFCETAIKALEQEPCEDCVSREAVLVVMRNNYRDGSRDIDGDYVEGNYSKKLYNAIISLPPVTPQPKTGHWIRVDKDKCKCDKCEVISFIAMYPNGDINFCPNCGTKMVEPQESGHKCHTCKHYTSGEHDGSCGSYICKGYSNWESEDNKCPE